MTKNWLSRAVGIIAASAATLSAAWAAPGNDWPSRPITIVVPFAAGGQADQLGRMLGQHLTEKLKQPVIVDNKPGAGTIIGSQFVARAKPDGYTFLLGGTTNILNFHTQPKMPYGRKDLQSVAELITTPLYLVTSPKSQFKTVQDVIQASKEKAGNVSCGNFGTGSISHLSCGMLAQMAGVEFLHVAYKGSAPLIQDTMAGQVDVAVIVEGLPSISAKKLHGLAVTTPERNPYTPDIPRMREALPSFAVTGWNGIFAPAGTPDAIVQRVAAEVNDMLQSEAIKSRLKAMGVLLPAHRTTAEFSAFVDQEFDRWGKQVKAMNVKLD